MKFPTKTFIAALLVASLIVLAKMPEHDPGPDTCHMIELWNQDKAKGIAPEKRNGWPPEAFPDGECSTP